MAPFLIFRWDTFTPPRRHIFIPPLTPVGAGRRELALRSPTGQLRLGQAVAWLATGAALRRTARLLEIRGRP
jgi:hypothetical protein